MSKIIIVGSRGRMGQALIACAGRISDLEVVAQVDQGDDLSKSISSCDVVVDFSFHSATHAIAALCASNRKAVVIGTTGHSDAERSQISNFKSQIPMVW